MAQGVRGFVAAFLLVAASVAFALTTAEACLRIFPQLMPEEFQQRRHWQETSRDRCGTEPLPGVCLSADHCRWKSSARMVASRHLCTDEHGFRNPSPWPKRADIVVLGDSMAFGYGVEDDEAWTALSGRGAAGRSDHQSRSPWSGAAAILRKISEKFGQTLRPALVLFCLFPGNDLGDAESFDRWVKAGSPGNYLLWRLRRWTMMICSTKHPATCSRKAI